MMTKLIYQAFGVDKQLHINTKTRLLQCLTQMMFCINIKITALNKMPVFEARKIVCLQRLFTYCVSIGLKNSSE